MNTIFSTSVEVSSSDLFLGLNVSPIGYFLITEVSGVFFILLLQGMRILSGVTLAKIYPCKDKKETLKMYL